MSGRRDPALDSCPPFRRHAEEFVVQARSQTAHFAVIDRETNLRVGMIGIHSIDQATGRLMLGYWVAPWAKGVAAWQHRRSSTSYNMPEPWRRPNLSPSKSRPLTSHREKLPPSVDLSWYEQNFSRVTTVTPPPTRLSIRSRYKHSGAVSGVAHDKVHPISETLLPRSKRLEQELADDLATLPAPPRDHP